MSNEKKILKKKKPITHTKDLPATMGAVLELRKIMETKFRSIDKHFVSNDKRFKSFDKRFESIDKRFESIDKKFESIDKRFDAIDKRFEAIDKRFEAIDKRFDAIDKRFEALENKMEARFNDLKSDMHRILILLEEQNTRNKFVLDGYTLLYERMDRLEINVETRIKSIEEIIVHNRKETLKEV
ncbi:MAG TPA: hypothetical protein PLJ21_06150 [Pseudobdellovibrionaceae bacterium]|nr:hypothetical protein [Pseudobdellovibrionaceae bacterium]